jgi:uncharacterized repeat protein (TIGR03803 family)
VYKLTPPVNGQGAWTATIIYRFTGSPDGSQPHGSLLLGKNGELYGTTYVGGSAGEGTVFELTPPASPGGKFPLLAPIQRPVLVSFVTFCVKASSHLRERSQRLGNNFELS